MTNRGVNMLAVVVKSMCKRFGIEGNYKNQSLRAVTCTALFAVTAVFLFLLTATLCVRQVIPKRRYSNKVIIGAIV